MDRRLIGAGALLAAIGIALGALGVHGLKNVLDAVRMGWWHTAVDYQMWSGVGLVGLGAAGRPRLALPGWLIAAGAAIFAATLYVMALGGPLWLGAVTPIGGALMVVGWLLAAWRAWRG